MIMKNKLKREKKKLLYIPKIIELKKILQRLKAKKCAHTIPLPRQNANVLPKQTNL